MVGAGGWGRSEFLMGQNWMVGMAAQGTCALCHGVVHLKMVKMYILCVFTTIRGLKSDLIKNLNSNLYCAISTYVIEGCFI